MSPIPREDDMSTFLVSVGIGLATAAILALSAVAFTLEYAVSRVANFAHGELLTIGAYAAYTGQRFFHQNVAAAALVAAVAGCAAGLAMNAALIEQFRGRSPITVFIATLGASLVLQNVLVIIYGAANVSYSFAQGGLHHIGPFLWTTSNIEVILSALAVAGLSFLLLTITATVAGGIGRPYATLGGALLVGLVIQVAGTYTSSAYQLVWAFGLLVLLMLFRPNGLFVRKSATAVRA